MTTSAKSLGALLRQLRDKTGLSQSDVSKQIGVSQALYSTWESGAATPKPDKLELIAAALQTDAKELMSFNPNPREPDVVLADLQRNARDFVQGYSRKYGAPAHDIWILGGTNLTSMKRINLMDRHWKELLGSGGFNYHFIWMMDLVDIDIYGTVLTTLATLARTVWEEKGATAGKIIHYAVQGYKPAPDAIECYRSFKKAAEETLPATSSNTSAADQCIETMHDLYPIETPQGTSEKQAALREAVDGLLREWQRDTGIVAYRPIKHAIPAAANIRLMPLAREIVTRVAPEIESQGRWFWLSPALTQRLMVAINRFSKVADEITSQAPKAAATPVSS